MIMKTRRQLQVVIVSSSRGFSALFRTSARSTDLDSTSVLDRLGTISRLLSTQTRQFLLRPSSVGSHDEQLDRRVKCTMLHRSSQYLERLVHKSR
jgi:hypothetical protein